MTTDPNNTHTSTHTVGITEKSTPSDDSMNDPNSGLLFEGDDLCRALTSNSTLKQLASLMSDLQAICKEELSVFHTDEDAIAPLGQLFQKMDSTMEFEAFNDEIIEVVIDNLSRYKRNREVSKNWNKLNHDDRNEIFNSVISILANTYGIGQSPSFRAV